MKLKSLNENLADANEAGVQFCLTDTETGLVLLNLSDTTQNDRSRRRQIGEAHTAYQSILHLLQRLTPSVDQQIILLERLELLRSRLILVGIPLGEIGQALSWTKHD